MISLLASTAEKCAHHDSKQRKNVHFLIGPLSLGDERFIHPSAEAQELHNEPSKPGQNVFAPSEFSLYLSPLTGKLKMCLVF